MTKPRLIYFDLPGSRGEECRLALHAAGVDFEDVRIPRAEWPALKPKTPYGALPVLEWPGKPALGHSIAIMTLIGRKFGLHPADEFEAARHEGLMESVEELRHKVTPALRMADEAQKKAAREELAKDAIAPWGTFVEGQLGNGPFVAGDKLNVADFKLYILTRWFVSGTLDHIPKTVLDHCPKLMRLYHAVGDHPTVKSWQNRKTA
jgi:glutathione S-transferase